MKNNKLFVFGLLISASISVFLLITPPKFLTESEGLQPPPSTSTPINEVTTPINQVKPTSPVEPVHLVFAGDAMMDWSVREAIKKHGPDYPFQYIKEEVMKADWAFVNLESSVTEETKKDRNQTYNFKSDPASLRGLKNAGFDIVSVANNHVLDFGTQGLLDTLKHLEQNGLKYVGAGKDSKEAYRAETIEIRGTTIKFLAFTRFMPTIDWPAGKNKPGVASAYEEKNVLPVIQRERKGADYLLVYMHWGVEKNNRPEPWQRQYAHKMIDAGADAIIGSHTHVLQGFEYYHNKPIAYSIGNFLFPDYVRNRSADTGLLKLTLDQGQISMEFNPYYIKNNQIRKRDKTYNEAQFAYLHRISYGVTFNGASIEDTVEVIQ